MATEKEYKNPIRSYFYDNLNYVSMSFLKTKIEDDIKVNQNFMTLEELATSNQQIALTNDPDPLPATDRGAGKEGVKGQEQQAAKDVKDGHAVARESEERANSDSGDKVQAH